VSHGVPSLGGDASLHAVSRVAPSHRKYAQDPWTIPLRKPSRRRAALQPQPADPTRRAARVILSRRAGRRGSS
jgi:hypothetical protein